MNQAGAPGDREERLTDLYSRGILSKDLPTVRAVDERWVAQGADMRWARRLPGLMAQAGLPQLDVATRPNCMGLGGTHDAFALASIRQLGGVMVKDGDITEAELNEVVALFDDPAFVDVRSVFISVWGQKTPRVTLRTDLP